MTEFHRGDKVRIATEYIIVDVENSRIELRECHRPPKPSYSSHSESSVSLSIPMRSLKKVFCTDDELEMVTRAERPKGKGWIGKWVSGRPGSADLVVNRIKQDGISYLVVKENGHLMTGSHFLLREDDPSICVVAEPPPQIGLT